MPGLNTASGGRGEGSEDGVDGDGGRRRSRRGAEPGRGGGGAGGAPARGDEAAAESGRQASTGGEDENERLGRFSEPLFNSLDEELADVEAERLAVADLHGATPDDGMVRGDRRQRRRLGRARERTAGDRKSVV